MECRRSVTCDEFESVLVCIGLLLEFEFECADECELKESRGIFKLLLLLGPSTLTLRAELGKSDRFRVPDSDEIFIDLGLSSRR